MTLFDLDEFFKTVQPLIVELKSYHFGYLYEMNEERNREYPLCLFIPPQPKYPDWYDPKQRIPIVLYFYGLYQSAENTVKGKAKKWSELQLIGEKFIHAFEIELPIVGSVGIEYGISEHNDKLAGVKFSFEIQMPVDCDISAVQSAISQLPEFVFNEVPGGVIDGTLDGNGNPTGIGNKVFTTAYKIKAGSSRVYLDSGRQRLVTDYAENTQGITFVNPPITGDNIIIDYIKA